MYISVKPAHFTDEELEIIHDSLLSDYEDLEVWFSEHDIDLEDEDRNSTLYALETIINKISDNGIFSKD